MSSPAVDIGVETSTVHDFSTEYIWHADVHSHFQEQLTYLLLRVRPFDIRRIDEGFGRLRKDKRLGGLRVYRLFGQHDLMIRVWIHPLTFIKFQKWIREYIPGIERELNPFIAHRLEYRWYPDVSTSRWSALIARLTPDLASRIEAGVEPAMLERYLEAGLIIRKRANARLITSFVTVKFPDGGMDEPQRRRLTSKVNEYLEQRKERFRFSEFDSGFGGWNMIVRARTSDYFGISELPEWLGQEYGVSTETYLSVSEVPTFCDTRLSALTFEDMRGQDSFVATLLPELYPKRIKRADEIEEYIGRLRTEDLSDGARKVIRSFLLGVLHNDVDELVDALHPLFRKTEAYLRRRHLEYLSRINLDWRVIYKEARVEKKPELATLWDFLQVCHHALRLSDRTLKSPPEGWQAFTELRNSSFHGGELRDNWRKNLDTVIRYWPELQALVTEIDSVTLKPDAHFRHLLWPEEADAVESDGD